VVSGGRDILWVNGRLARAADARLDPRDRGFALGDGLFETMRAKGGAVLRIERHLARLRAGAEKIGLPLTWSDEELAGPIHEVLEANGLPEATVRLTLSRGVPRRRGLLPDPEPVPSLAVEARPFVGYPARLYETGMRAVTSRVPRNERSPLANVKSLSYLENVLARREAEAGGADEALLLNTAGLLACASAANLFLVVGGTLVTPGLASGALPGITRGLVLNEMAPLTGLDAVERKVRPEELAEADEAFLTSALLGVMPLTEADGRPVGTGEPGTVSAGLGELLDGSERGQ